jgi:hypothetical protein
MLPCNSMMIELFFSFSFIENPGAVCVKGLVLSG